MTFTGGHLLLSEYSSSAQIFSTHQLIYIRLEGSPGTSSAPPARRASAADACIPGSLHPHQEKDGGTPPKGASHSLKQQDNLLKAGGHVDHGWHLWGTMEEPWSRHSSRRLEELGRLRTSFPTQREKIRGSTRAVGGPESGQRAPDLRPSKGHLPALSLCDPVALPWILMPYLRAQGVNLS